jgi:serine/threonine-protein kinase
MEKPRTLADVLAERGCIASPELERAFVSILADLEQAHGSGTFHGDIKPSRIVAAGSGSYRLVNPGASRVAAAKYVAPERVRGGGPDVPSDIYALGAVLYEAATGRPPFLADVNSAIMAAHLSQSPQRPSELRSTVTPGVEAVILRALAKKPEERFQSAAEFRSALAAVVPKEAPSPAAPKPEPPATTPPARATEPPRAVEPPPAVKPPREPATRPATARPLPSVVPVAERRRASAAVWLIPLFVVAAGAAAYFLFGRDLVKSSVPSVVGLSREEAGGALAKAGLSADFGQEVDDTVMAGRVARQLPEPGARVGRGSTVELSVSTGLVVMPDLAGLDESEARVRLRTLGLEPLTASEFSDRHQAGTVMETSTRAGARLRPRSQVRLTIAVGRATCADCGAPRSAGARFCTECGKPFVGE